VIDRQPAPGRGPWTPAGSGLQRSMSASIPRWAGELTNPSNTHGWLFSRCGSPKVPPQIHTTASTASSVFTAPEEWHNQSLSHRQWPNTSCRWPRLYCSPPVNPIGAALARGDGDAGPLAFNVGPCQRRQPCLGGTGRCYHISLSSSRTARGFGLRVHRVQPCGKAALRRAVNLITPRKRKPLTCPWASVGTATSIRMRRITFRARATEGTPSMGATNRVVAARKPLQAPSRWPRSRSRTDVDKVPCSPAGATRGALSWWAHFDSQRRLSSSVGLGLEPGCMSVAGRPKACCSRAARTASA